MVELSNRDAEIAIIGRSTFDTGIGAVGFATCEMLARSFPVCFLPTEPHLRAQRQVVLPNGRAIPVCHDPGRIKVSFFCDVLWNGAADLNYALAPPDSLKYAWLVYDSDQLPAQWTQLLNTHFDLVVAASPHLVDIARASGVETPIATMPIPLDLEPLLAESLPHRDRGVVRFGSVAAFHPRKGVLILVEAFLARFAGRADVQLVLHSNLAIGAIHDQVLRLASCARNITITHGPLSAREKNRLIRSFDVFVNCSRG